MSVLLMSSAEQMGKHSLVAVLTVENDVSTPPLMLPARILERVLKHPETPTVLSTIAQTPQTPFDALDVPGAHLAVRHGSRPSPRQADESSAPTSLSLLHADPLAYLDVDEHLERCFSLVLTSYATNSASHVVSSRMLPDFGTGKDT